MKKRGNFFVTLVLLLSFVTSPLSVYTLETHGETTTILPEETLVVPQPLLNVTTPEDRSLAGAATLFNGLTFSQYAAALPSTLTLGASFLGTVAAPIVLPAILGASVAYGSLQLGNQLGVYFKHQAAYGNRWLPIPLSSKNSINLLFREWNQPRPLMIFLRTCKHAMPKI